MLRSLGLNISAVNWCLTFHKTISKVIHGTYLRQEWVIIYRIGIVLGLVIAYKAILPYETYSNVRQLQLG